VNKTVLVVDDSASVRREVSAALEGFDIVEASDGVEGAEAIEQREDLNLVICDVNMPRMTGIEMLERVKDRLSPGGVKVVMLTTEGQPKLIKRARELGAVGWIVKPFNPAQLLAAARKLTA
jgi:two-component system, chemotaxis family, chemotaxis protein CheY